jgi:hypothetical protein
VKWLIVALISPNADAFGLVDLYVYTTPFPTQVECQAYVNSLYYDFQLDLNEKHDSVGIEYPIACIPEKEVYDSIPDST